MKTPWQSQEDVFIVPRGGWILITVIFLSVFLAGGRPLWAQGTVCFGIGLLWLLRTPSGIPAKQVVIALALLIAVPLIVYLPGASLGLPSWREALLKFPPITRSPFITPQPYLTLQAYLLWLSGVALAAWCACQDWDHYQRGSLARLYAGAILAVTIFAFFGKSTGYQPSWWISTDGFGPFANRNQWGSAMAMAGVVSVALVHQCIRQAYKQGAIFWILAAAVFTAGILYNGSRGGLVILFGGVFLYWAFYGLVRSQYQYAAVGLSFLLIAFALFALGGGALLERFVGLREVAEGAASEDARLQFYRMTMSMVAGSPLAGFGLGNFENVFPFYLDFEPFFDRRPVHPESSWLWLASEGGWLLLVAVAAAVAVLVLNGFSARKSRAATIRSVGLACALALAFNSAFDVSGHRLGTLFPAIMVASLALPSAKASAWPAIASVAAKCMGAVLSGAGVVWILGGWGIVLAPALQGTTAMREQAHAAMKAGRADEAVAMLRRSESLQPLDWGTHWTLSDWLLKQGKLEPAWEEFQAANALLPYLHWTMQEGAEKWMLPSPGRAATAILDTMRRAPESKRSEIYSSFLAKSKDNPRLKAMLWRLFPDEPEFELARIRQADPQAAAKLLARLVARTESLSRTPESINSSVLRLMLERNQLADIDAVASENPRLKRTAWEVFFERELRSRRTKEALDIYFSFGPRPAVPATLNRSDLRSVERAAALAPLDLSTSIAYYQALVASQRSEDASWQLRHVMELPKAPAYVWFLASQAAYRDGDYEESLKLLRAYQEKTKK